MDSNRPSLGIEITVFAKDGGPLTKRIFLDSDGKIISDGSACVMYKGKAKRAKLNDGVAGLAKLINGLHTNEAIGLGTLRADFPNEVDITTKAKLNGGSSAIARTAENLVFELGRHAFALADYDTKGMTASVAAKLAERGGFWKALVSIIPELASCAHLIRASTSAGLSRSDTDEKFPGSGGLHGFIAIKDGSDVGRFVVTLHERCWLAGLGWMMVGVGGQLLERSIVDKSVGSPERLVFEGPPVVVPPLQQDPAGRRPTVVEGELLDTIAACKPLTVVERGNFNRLKAAEAVRLGPESNRAKEAFIASQQQRLMSRTGMSADAARIVIEKQTRHILLASIELPFDDPDLDGKTVGDVLDDPALYEGETLADPIEGVSYGRGKAKVMRKATGEPFINSFAHGGAIYQLLYDAASIRTRIAASDNPVATFIKLALNADLDDIEVADLIGEVARLSGKGVRAIAATLKSAEKEKKKRQREEMQQRLMANRGDQRPIQNRPHSDAEWLPVMQDVNDVVVGAETERQSRRDIDGTIIREKRMPISETHAFTNANANADEEEDTP